LIHTAFQRGSTQIYSRKPLTKGDMKMIISFIFAVGTLGIGLYLYMEMFPSGESFTIASMGDLMILATVFLMGVIFLTGAFIAAEIDSIRRLIKKRLPEKENEP
jgi:uncharacterized BrkB/YihY/UPF0761 family membrane protein